MTGVADADLVIAAVQADDALHRRATGRLRGRAPLTVPLSVSIELLLGARSRGTSCVDALAAWEQRFLVEEIDVLYTAADALDRGEVSTVFDAVHLAIAAHRGTTLDTADERLQRTAFPTTAS